MKSNRFTPHHTTLRPTVQDQTHFSFLFEIKVANVQRWSETRRHDANLIKNK